MGVASDYNELSSSRIFRQEAARLYKFAISIVMFLIALECFFMTSASKLAKHAFFIHSKKARLELGCITRKDYYDLVLVFTWVLS